MKKKVGTSLAAVTRRFEVFKNALTGKHQWRVVDDQTDRTIMVSEQSYTRAYNAVKMALREMVMYPLNEVVLVQIED